MVIAKITVSGVSAHACFMQKIPKGIVGATVEIEYTDGIWTDLQKTVVFQGCVTKDVLNAGSAVTIPAECVAKSGTRLQVGIYGTDAESRIAVPTLWCDLGVVQNAADPSGDESTDPSLPVWVGVRADIGNLDKLATETKKSLVDAINELVANGTGGITINGQPADENGNFIINTVSDVEISRLDAALL